MVAHELVEEQVEPGRRDLGLLWSLLPYVSGHWGELLLALLLLPVATACQVGATLVIRGAIDDTILAGRLGGLWVYLAVFLALVGLEALARFAHGVCLWSCGQGVMLALRARIASTLERAPMPFHDANPSGRLLTRVTTDVESLNELFTSGAVAVVGDVLTAVAILATMLALDARMALIVLACLPLLWAILGYTRGRLKETFEYSRARMARMTAHLAERLAGIEVVKTCRHERASTEQFASISREYTDGYHRSNLLEASLYAGVELTGQLAVAGLIVVGGGGIVAGRTSLGTLVAFVRYVEEVFAPLRDMSAKFAVFQSALTSMAKIEAVLAVAPEPDPAPRAGRTVGRGDLTFQDVTFAYRPGETVLSDFTLSVASGQRVAVVGPTGAGKTTLVKLLARLYTPSQGHVLVDGHPVGEYPLAHLREAIAFLPQDLVVFTGSVLDNVTLGRAGIARERASAALEDVGAGPLLARLPRGVDTVLAERGADLSFGERQLVALARVLVLDPRIVVLDEATSAIDPLTEAGLRPAIDQALAGRTAIVIAHRLSTVMGADRIVVLSGGRLVEEGDHAALMARGGLYARLAAHHFGTARADQPVTSPPAGVPRCSSTLEAR